MDYKNISEIFSVDENDYEVNTKNTDILLDDFIKIKQNTINNIKNNTDNYKYFYEKNFMSNDICDFIVNECEKIALKNISDAYPTGWMTNRHKKYPTTDLPLKLIGNLFTPVRNILISKLFPIIEEKYNVSKYFLDFNDIFIVKYKDTEQSELERHKDGSAFSFNILLNHPSNFTGGGTIINQDSKDILVNNTKGGLVVHSGQTYHQGNLITSGTRYIMVGFISYMKHIADINTNKLLNTQNNIFNNKSDNFNVWNISLKSKCIYENLLNCLVDRKDTFLINTTQDKYYLLEKFVYDMAMFHFDRLNIKFDPEIHYIEYWWKVENIDNNLLKKSNNIIHNFHTDKDEDLFNSENTHIYPILSSVTYLNDSFYPTVITNLKYEEMTNNDYTNENNEFILSFPKKMKHISFDGSNIHGVCNIMSEDIIDNTERKTIMFNLWEKHSPKNVVYRNFNDNCEIINNLYERDEKILKVDSVNDISFFRVNIKNDVVNKIIKNFILNNIDENIKILDKYLKSNISNNKHIFKFNKIIE